MKLETKYLAPYLPYKIIMQCGTIGRRILTHDYWDDNKVCLETVLKSDNIKPILRPLSDLTKEIDIDEPNVLFRDWIESEFDINIILFTRQFDIDMLPYNVIEYLLEWHFDIFGLIEKGLAIDKNTIE